MTSPVSSSKTIDTKAPLPQEFYLPDSREVAKNLLGKLLVHLIGRTKFSGIIVETEAYRPGDPASHAWKSRTSRNEVMFGAPGYAYVYFSYGMHNLLNFVCEPEGIPSAVLIRALEPVENVGLMIKNRRGAPLNQLTNGPGKLTQALLITLAHNGKPVFERNLTVHPYQECSPDEIAVTTRIGISQGTDLLWRFYLKGNDFVSSR